MKKTKDEIIDELIEKTQQKKREIETLSKPVWQTNCSFKKGDSPSINIKTVTDIKVLVGMMAHIITEENSYKEANTLLGTNIEYEFCGFSADSWASDLKTRIDVVNITTKKKELQDIEEKLDSLISKERKEELLLEKIMKTLES